MKSIIVTKHGGPEVLSLREVPIPEPATGQVLIRVVACGINYADIMQRVGLYPNGPTPPFGAGFEVSGVVERAGEGVTNWKPGDAVAGFCESGYSEYVVADAKGILAKPEHLDFLQAAAIPCQYLTAYHALCTLGRLEAGQTVLIHAAAGGLGTMMVQIARNLGARIIGTCGTDEKCALLAELGCDHPVNYGSGEFADRVTAIAGKRGCDLIVESVGGDVLQQSLTCLKPRGMLITLGVASGQPPVINAVQLLANNWIVAGFHLMDYVSDGAAMKAALQQLHQWLSLGKLTVIVNHALPLEEAAHAHKLISGRQTTGKVVLTTGYHA